MGVDRRGDPDRIRRYLLYRLMLMTADIYYNDLAFMYKLKLFKVAALRARWLSATPATIAGIVVQSVGRRRAMRASLSR